MACEEENVLLQEKLDAAAKEDTQVFVKFRKNQNFPGSAFAPLKKTRALMMLAIKDFFSEELSPEHLPSRSCFSLVAHLAIWPHPQARHCDGEIAEYS